MITTRKSSAYRRLGRWLAIGACLAGCAVSPPRSATMTDLGPVPSFDRSAMPEQDGGRLRREALDYYARGDYVRALRYGYWAAQTIPTDVRLRLLLGIVYDGGFDRPDLALPEYRRALSLDPDRRFRARLERRVHFLNRRLIQDATRSSLIDNSGIPLSENWLAVYPLRTFGPRTPDVGLEIGLIDWVLPDIKKRSAGLHVDPFTSWIVAQVYREIASAPTAESYARWCGAGLVLTGSLTDLGRDRLRIELELLDAGGRIVYASNPFEVDTADPADARRRILEEASTALGLLAPDREAPSPVTNPAAMMLYAQGLAQYLVGQVAEAERALADALAVDPDSPFLASRHRWARSDRLGATEGADLLADYHRLLNLPDPDRVVRERLSRGHALADPAASMANGTEPTDPFKPPRPDVAAP